MPTPTTAAGAQADVLIIGAGPAGAFLGYLLARAGMHVILLDKSVFPREKVCGGGLSNKTIELMPFDIGPVVHRHVNGAFLTFQNRSVVVKDLESRGGVAVLRSEFDAFLLQRALEAGARFVGNAPFVSIDARADGVTVAAGSGVFTARYAVGADGVFSAVRQAWFGRDLVRYAPAVEALVSVTPEKAGRIGDRVLFDFGGMPRGYGWIFPKRDHLNVGVFSIYPSRSINADLVRFMSRYRILDEPLGVRRLGFSIPLTNRRRQFERGPVLLVGDAAGLAEAFYGEGIYYALRSAQLAATALVATFGQPDTGAYTALIRRHLLADLRYSELNARLFFSAQTIGFSRMVQNAHVNSYFAELIAGGMGHRSCFYRTMLTAPYWLFSRRLPRYEGLRF